jgi:serine/threonine protein kinase
MAVIAYEMITGRRPFRPPSALEMLKMQKSGVRIKPRTLREDLSSKAQNIILTALSFEPMARYQSAKKFGDDLEKALIDDEQKIRHTSALWPWIKSPFTVIGGALILALLSYVIYISFYQSQSPPRPSNVVKYWVMVQRMRDGTEYEAPFQSLGVETFENGDKFQLNVLTTAPGYLYILNEGPPEPYSASFRMVYPNKTINSGSSSIGANQTVPSDWITFRGPRGAESFWIVWSVSPVDELESAKTEAYKHPQQGLIDPNLAALKEFLKVTEVKVDSQITRYKETRVAWVRGKTDILVTRVEFQHR